MSRKGNKADLAPSRRERKGIGQYIHCSADYLLYWYSSRLSQMKLPLTRMVSASFLRNGQCQDLMQCLDMVNSYLHPMVLLFS